MNLAEFIDLLNTAELSQHYMGDTDDAMNLKYLPKIVTLVNQGIKELHTKFLIKKGSLYLCLDGCTRRYHLCHKEPYVVTEDCPLRLLEVLEIFSCDGTPVRLNANHRDMNLSCCVIDVFMPDYRTLEFSVNCGQFRINFRRNGEVIPNPLKVDRFNPEEIKIDIPDAYIDALLYYVASKLFTTIIPNSQAGAVSQGNIYYQRYITEIQRLQEAGFNVSGVNNETQRFRDSGMP